MLIEANEIGVSSALAAADVVIAGAGTVGLLVAKILADGGLTVAVVEAGSSVSATSADGLGASSVGHPHSGVVLGRGMGLGGTSVLWGGQLAEFVEHDLTRPGYEWSLSFSELCKLYERTFLALGLGKPLPDTDLQAAFGIVAPKHATIEQFFTYWLPQPNFATLFSQQILKSDKIRVYLGAIASDMLFDDDRATALVFSTASGKKTIQGRAFVMAAGTIANIQFFLSTARRSEVPWRNNGMIGQYFQDHLGCKVCELEVLDAAKFRSFFENGIAFGHKLQPKLRFTRAARSHTDTEVCGIMSFRSSVGAQLAQFKSLVRSMRSGLSYSTLRTFPADVLRLGSSFAPLIVRYLKDRRIMAFFDEGVDFLIQAEQLPVARSRVDLVEGALLPSGLHRVVVGWQIDGREVSVIRRFVDEALDFLETNGLARLRPGTGLPVDDDAVRARLADTFHQCGGLRMSSTPSAGVTDPNARVWGTENVYVAGAAVMPTSSYANSTLTALALGVRLTDHLLKSARPA